MILDSVLKLFFPEVLNGYANLKSPEGIFWIGIVELCCVLIYLFPITMSVGFFLISCYWGIVIGIGIFNSNLKIYPVLILLLFLISMHYRGSAILFKIQ